MAKNRRAKNIKKILSIIVFDLVLAGVGLLIFAFFHHVVPKKGGEGTVLTSPQTVVTQPADDNAGGDESGEQPVLNGDFSDKFTDKFTAGEVIKTDSSFKNRNVNVTLEKKSTAINGKQEVIFVADIYVRTAQYFMTGFADDTYGSGYAQSVVEFAKEKNAIFAVNGDYYGARSVGVVVRNGVSYRDVLYEDVLVLWNDGTMATFEKGDFDFDAVQAQHGGMWQAWSFGPQLLTGGQSMTEFNSKVMPSNPRTAIGYYEPGHYCIVVVDGRQNGYADGLRMEELSTFMAELGCTVAYNLDGGQSSVMAWDGALANSPAGGGRKTSDFVYIPEE